MQKYQAYGNTVTYTADKPTIELDGVQQPIEFTYHQTNWSHDDIVVERMKLGGFAGLLFASLFISLLIAQTSTTMKPKNCRCFQRNCICVIGTNCTFVGG